MNLNEDTVIASIEKIIEKTPTRELKNLTVQKLSNIVGFNEKTLRQKYQRKRGFHLSKLIFHKKLQKAYELLKNYKKMRVEDISNIIGYEKTESFRKVIKNTFGKTPSQIKNTSKKK